MTDPVRVPGMTVGFHHPLARRAAVLGHAASCFETHPTVDSLIFEVAFPDGIESVTVSREEILSTPPRDFEAWKREVETR